MFGEDAQPKKNDNKKKGIVLEQSQLDTLNAFWHCSNPDRLSAFEEKTKEDFPLDESMETTLQVPSLEPLIEAMLVKRHGKKAAFTKGQSLFTQPLKGIEKSAYLGQVASKMGIVVNSYMQQSLGLLLANLKSENPNADEAIQMTRDIFNMSQTALNQTARAGAFHQIIRRKAAISDTGLSDCIDVSELSVPLSSDGVFGCKLEEKLQTKKRDK